MSFVTKGALIEYASDFLGPLPNVVVFQFNPNQLTRQIKIPERPTGASSREPTQAGDLPVEHISLTLQLTADDAFMPPFIKTVGILPPLAALEKMVRPAGPIFGPNVNLDSVGQELSGAAGDGAVQLIPREKYPAILFIWGATRILPVEIESMSFTEKQFDPLLNPIVADVTLGMNVIIPDELTTDSVARGASRYSEGAKEVLAALNLGFALRQVVDMVTF